MCFFNITNTQDLMVVIYLPSYPNIYNVYIWTLIGHDRLPLWSTRSRKCWGTIRQIQYQNLLKDYINCTLSNINTSKNSQGISTSFLERSCSDVVRRVSDQPVKMLPPLSHSSSFLTYNLSLIKVKCSRLEELYHLQCWSWLHSFGENLVSAVMIINWRRQ